MMIVPDLVGDCILGVGELDTEHWISCSCRRMVSASSAICAGSEGGGMLVKPAHRAENSSAPPPLRSRDLVLVTFLGMVLTLTSWLNLTWRDSETLECSDRREGDRFTCTLRCYQSCQRAFAKFHRSVTSRGVTMAR